MLLHRDPLLLPLLPLPGRCLLHLPLQQARQRLGLFLPPCLGRARLPCSARLACSTSLRWSLRRAALSSASTARCAAPQHTEGGRDAIALQQ